MEALRALIDQSWPPKAKFTEKNVDDLAGKVYIITGANTGLGKILAEILYSKNATVHVAARSEEKATAAMDSIRTACPQSQGQLEFLFLDLADLETVASAAKSFLAKAARLDVLFNNAGIMHPPQGTTSKQGYELHLGVNNLGHALFAELLTPLLAKTARESPANQVRVIWVSSLYVDVSAPKGGYAPDNIDYSKKDESPVYKYAASKAGVYYQAVVYGRRHKAEGIVSVPVHPGSLATDLQRYYPEIVRRIGAMVLLWPPINGAYTELFSGLSPDITVEESGTLIIPFGRLGKIRPDIHQGGLPVAEGGTGLAETWFDWCLEQIQPFL